MKLLTNNRAFEWLKTERDDGPLAPSPAFWLSLAAGGLAIGMTAGAISNAAYGQTMPIEQTELREALKLRLPKTRITSVACDGLGGLCEVVAGRSLFYVDRAARFLVIGRVYDMETRADVTAARLLALNPATLVAGAAKADNAGEDAVPAAAPKVIDLAELPRAGGVAWGPVGGPKLTVLSDFNCGYCKRLTEELQRGGFRVDERPISIFGQESRKLSEAVLCSADPAAALHAAYAGQKVAAPRCDVSGLDANEAFAKRHGFAGTPVVIRADGTVAEGYRSAAQLLAFVQGNKE